MKTKLLIAIVSIISVVSVATAVASHADNDVTVDVPANAYCENIPVRDWVKTLS